MISPVPMMQRVSLNNRIVKSSGGADALSMEIIIEKGATFKTKGRGPEWYGIFLLTGSSSESSSESGSASLVTSIVSPRKRVEVTRVSWACSVTEAISRNPAKSLYIRVREKSIDIERWVGLG
jgi:hypothetical protein